MRSFSLSSAAGLNVWSTDQGPGKARRTGTGRMEWRRGSPRQRGNFLSHISCLRKALMLDTRDPTRSELRIWAERDERLRRDCDAWSRPISYFRCPMTEVRTQATAQEGARRPLRAVGHREL